MTHPPVPGVRGCWCGKSLPLSRFAARFRGLGGPDFISGFNCEC